MNTRIAAGMAMCMAIGLGLAGCATAELPTGTSDGPTPQDARRDGRLSIDAPAIVDAPPDACVPGQRQLLTNASFDLTPVGNGWTQTPANATIPIIAPPPTGVTAASAPNIAWMGGAPSAVDQLSQELVVPAGATGFTLTGKLQIATAEFGLSAFDTVVITVQNSTGATVATLKTFSNLDENAAFAPFTLNSPMSFAGQTVRLNFKSSTDASFNTNFFFDDLAVNVVAGCQ